MTIPDMSDLYPAPFPQDVPLAPLQRLSLDKLLHHDPAEAERLTEVCTDTGFFYLDMMDHPMGRKMWEDACVAVRSGIDVLPRVPMAEKKAFKAPADIKVLDRGYQTGFVKPDGQPRDSEMFMVPAYEVFTKTPNNSFEPPAWLSQHMNSFQRAMVSGNRVANTILSVLEQNLQLSAGSFTDLHRLTDSSGDFLRVLRYPAAEADDGKPDNARFPAHKDAVSIAMLFTWVGGLQIADPEAVHQAQGGPVPEESWRWVQPLPGHAIVNLGEAMEIFSNQVLRSGLHRVVKAPGPQVAHDKYSVLLVVRPRDDTLMQSFQSPVIPQEEGEKHRESEVMTSIEWGNSKIRRLQDHIDKTFTERSGKAFALDRSWKQGKVEAV
ncbi:hypothetical protein FE257_008150 [Aspergillus nanangensis]|uniref:Fe2OG dioxygenase domain-containing protein n=1 Tax=Aspergillus nanangensis TaxID=2582783 RepID=A0AAD4CLZ7_ASPNN|nr:hypothetical protein FE257_008150 [Aspergillus nanangensis]